MATAMERAPVTRNLYASTEPGSTVPQVYVGDQRATVLRFQKDCDPTGTKLLGWEGWFEPLLVGGKSVLLVPLRNLDPQDRLPLLVTFTDGTELPLIVTAREGRVDQHVNVFLTQEAPEAVRAALADALERERALQEENERHRKEQVSTDHALAALLASGATRQTPFIERQKWVLRDGEVETVVRVYSGKSKAAVVFEVTNQSLKRPWHLMEARLWTTSSGAPRPFALRMDRDVVALGTSGRLAIVVDKSAFRAERGGPANLGLELFRHDGLQQAYVLLDQRLARE